jgi:hypothetical protein
MNKSLDLDASVLEDCEKLCSEPLAYKTEYFIIEADEKYILKAVAWAKCIETDVYPIMLNMMGHKPTVNLHSLHFEKNKLLIGGRLCNAGFYKIARFRNTQYVGSNIRVFQGLLDKMPPYHKEGYIVHEIIHGLLHEAKHGSKNRTESWQPIRQGKSHLL